MLRIGSIDMDSIAGLAPMAGVTDAAMRLICAQMGASWSVSEMLSAKGWILSKGKNENALALLQRFQDEGICGLQLFGREPEYLRDAALSLEHLDFAFIDLNFGCPAPKITGNGEGSALMKEPEQIGKIVKAVSSSIKKPVTVKFRSGWDENSINAVEVAQICEQNGARAICIHGRTRMQQYSGKADWNIIRGVKKAVSIPVIGNGDVRSGQDAMRMLSETDCDGIVIGRGAQGNPWVFSEIRDVIAGKQPVPVTPRERVDMIMRHMQLEIELHGSKGGLLEMRKHIAWYISGMKGAARFRDRINTLTSEEDVRNALMEFSSTFE